MKDKILRMAGVKTEKQLYDLFPTEESFIAKYGKQLKKLQMGASISGIKAAQAYQTENNKKALQFNYSPVDVDGSELEGYSQQPVRSDSFKNGLYDSKSISGNLPGYNPDWQTFKSGNMPFGDMLGKATKGIPIMGDVVKAIQMRHDERENYNQAKQWNGVTDVNLLASQTRPEQIERKYLRPEDMIINPGELNNPYGEGTNVLNAQDGGKFMKGLGQFGDAGGFNTLGNIGNYLAGGQNAGTAWGDVAASVADFIPGIGPIAKQAIKPVAELAGTLLDRLPAKTNRINNDSIDNVTKMGLGYGMQNLQHHYNSFVENGGEIPNPQIIKGFGRYSEDPMMDTLRTGGNIRQNNIEDLQLYEGGAQQVSPDMIKFNGPSHADGGMDIAYGGNPVEVEGGEYATEVPDDNGDTSLVVLGNLRNPLTGHKFKRDGALLAKKQEKATKSLNTAIEKIGETDMNDKFGRVAFDTWKLKVDVSSKKLQEYDDEKNKYIAMQSAINDTAEEHGLIADDLAKGNIKMAKNGGDINKAQDGKTVSSKGPVEPTFNGYPISSFELDEYDAYNNIKAPRWWNQKAEQMEGRKDKNTFRKSENPEQFRLIGMLKSKWETEKAAWNKSHPAIAIKEHPSRLIFANYPDEPKEATASVKTNTNNVQSASKLPESDTMTLIKKYFPKDQWNKAYEVMMKESKGNHFNVGINNDPKVTNPKGQYWNSKDSGLFQINSVAHPDVYKGGDVFDPEYNIKSAAEIYKKEGWKAWPKTSGVNRNQNIKQEEQRIPLSIPKPEVKIDQTGLGIRSINERTPMPTTPVSTSSEKDKFPWMQAINSLIPYLRPSDIEGLDPRQLMGEMYAMSNNQVEPVQAQLYHPQLDVPYDISYQDKLNELTAQERAASRMAGYNPAMQSMMAGQAYGPKSNVLAEQFRANQAEKDNVYSGNRNIMNDAQFKNLNILDSQYTRQEQAKSNTKAVTQAALDSISSKYLQNQLQNRTLGTYENLYNYRYDDRFRAQNMNPLAQFSPYGSGQIPPGVGMPLADNKKILYEYDANRGYVPSDITNAPRTKAKGRNGALVKAIKSL